MGLRIKLALSYIIVILASLVFAAFFLLPSHDATNRSLPAFIIFAVTFSILVGLLAAAYMARSINDMIRVLRKQADGEIEEKIQRMGVQNQRFEAIFNSMMEGVIVINGMGRIVSINPTVEKTFGISREKTEGMLFLEAIRNNELWEVINSVLKNGSVVLRQTNIVYPVCKIFQSSATPIFEKEKVSGCLVVIHDITEMKKLETMRSDFVANISHELKTPLTSIKGFVETLLDGALDDKDNARGFLKIIQNHAKRLEGLVDDILSLAHLESKDIVLDKKEFDLRGHIEEIISGFGAHIKKKNISIKNELPTSLMINADRDRIDQVVTNLIDNAIKFNRENGLIRIHGQREGDLVKVVIEDTGAGIPEKDSARIFERFYRVDKARARHLGGTGLGLSIVKHIIELHGGSVGVKSTEGLGSGFWFTLPIR